MEVELAVVEADSRGPEGFLEALPDRHQVLAGGAILGGGEGDGLVVCVVW